jgi:hypothetical protein
MASAPASTAAKASSTRLTPQIFTRMGREAYRLPYHLAMDENGVVVRCPYCGELQELILDPDSTGSMVQDCEVCCKPWAMSVTRTRSGRLNVDLARID